MTALRPLGILALALVLALTSGTLAAARGQARAAGEIVLCTGSGTVSVAVDAEGRPVAPAHICPDCALSLMAGLEARSDLPPRLAAWSRTAWPIPSAELAPTRRKAPAHARGPPVPT